MAGVLFAAAFTVTCLRSLLVVDHVSSSNVVARVTHVVSSIGSDQGRRVQATSPITSPRQQSVAASAGALRVRILHKRLLAMHVMACIHILACTAEHILPVTDISCSVARRAGMASLLLYDACLVLFLLAKTSVTNGSRTLAGWETCITWWSRFYAWFYLPLSATLLAAIVPIVANEEGTACLSGSKAENDLELDDTYGYISSNVMLIIQYVLLLAMFIKPMLVPQGSTQSGGAIYRRVVNRNILCTVCIVFSYIVTTLVVVLAYARSSPKAALINQAAPAMNMVATLFITEIALPLGFSSCYKSVVATRNLISGQNNTQHLNERNTKTKTQGTSLAGTARAAQPTGVAVVPVEENVP